MPGFGYDDKLIPSADGLQLFRFSANGRHHSTINALTGAVIQQFDYDDTGYLIRVTDGSGNVTTIDRESDGTPLAIIAADGQRTTLTLDDNGFLTGITNPAGESRGFSYSDKGLLLTATDARNNGSRFSYDQLGRLIQDEDAAGGVQTLSRLATADGYQASLTSPLGRTTDYLAEKLATGDRRRLNTYPDGSRDETVISTGEVRTTTHADGSISVQKSAPDPRFGMLAPIVSEQTVETPAGLQRITQTTRTAELTDSNDPLSLTRLTETVTRNGRVHASAYDAETRTITTNSPENRLSTRVTDPQGRTVSAHTPGLETVRYAYDDRGRLAATTVGEEDETARITTVTYDAGYPDILTDALGRTTDLDYDAAGRMTRLQRPDGREIRFEYDANGNRTAIIPPDRSAHLFHYTALDQESAYEPPELDDGATVTHHTYDLDHHLTRIDRPDGQAIVFNYNDAGQLSSRTTPRGQSQYAFDETSGQLTSITAPDGGVLSLIHDGPLLRAEQWQGEINGTVTQTFNNDFWGTARSVNGTGIDFEYDTDGLLTRAGDLTLAYDADNGLLTDTGLGTVASHRQYNGFGETSRHHTTLAGATLLDIHYQRDKLGRITQKTETINGLTHTYDYEYDLAGRLTTVQRDGHTTAEYTYDANGNRLTHTSDGNTATGDYDQQDRLLRYGANHYTHTANGERLSKTNSDGTTGYDYDVLGNLRTVTLPDGRRLDYVIDGRNRRIGKKVNGTLVQGFLYRDSLNPIAELGADGNVLSRFIYADKSNVPAYMIKGGIIYRYITDHLGSPRLLVDVNSGEIAQRIDYDEFGQVILDSNPGFQPFSFAGGLYDADTGLVRFGARDYDPQVGRWTAKDPIRFDGDGVNLYGYVMNDPINLVDVSGNESQCPECIQEAINSYSLEKSINVIVGFGVGSAVFGGGIQTLNKTAKKKRSGISAGGPSGRYTSYTRSVFGKGIGRTIGRIPISRVASRFGIIGAGVSAWKLHYDALQTYRACKKKKK